MAVFAVKNIKLKTWTEFYCSTCELLTCHCIIHDSITWCPFKIELPIRLNYVSFSRSNFRVASLIIHQFSAFPLTRKIVALMHCIYTPDKWKKMHFSVTEKSGNFEETGKVRKFYPKYWKSGGILPKILEKRRNLSQFLFLFIYLFWSASVK